MSRTKKTKKRIHKASVRNAYYHIRAKVDGEPAVLAASGMFAFKAVSPGVMTLVKYWSNKRKAEAFAVKLKAAARFGSSVSGIVVRKGTFKFTEPPSAGD